MSISGLIKAAFSAVAVAALFNPALTLHAQDAESAPAADGASAPEPEVATAESAAEPTAAEPAAGDVAAESHAVIPVENIAPEAEASTEVAEEAAGDAVRLDEIVVTARKRTESIQDVPLSVKAFSAKDMEQRGYNSIEDIAAATPGFTYEPFATGGAHGNPVIRGLSSQFTTARVQNVSFFLDGVYLQRQSMLNLGMIDMERIEVVKGPQNALYGRSAFAGAINYITLQPGTEWEGYVSLGSGDNEREETRLSVAGPLNEAATILVKATYGAASYDGHTKNNHPVADADPAGPNLRGMIGGQDDTIYSLSLAYEPSEVFKVRASYYNSEQIHEAAPSYSLSGVNAARFGLRFDDQNDLNCNVAEVEDIQPQPPRTHTGFSAWCGELPRYASDVAERRVQGMVVDPRAIGTLAETKAMTFTSEYNFSDSLSMHYLYGFADHSSYTDGGASDEDPIAGRGIVIDAVTTQVDNQDPSAYAFINTASSRPNTVLKTFSHELHFNWEVSDRLRTSFGGYYSQVEDEEWTALFMNDLCNADNAENRQNCNEPLSAPNTLAERTIVTAGIAWDQFTREHGGAVRGEWTAFEDKIKAVFGSASYEFTDGLEATLEARYTVEDRAVQRFTDAFAVAPGEVFCYGANCFGQQPNDAQCTVFTDPSAPVVPAANCLVSMIDTPQDEAKFTNFTPRAILNWKYAPEHSVYGSAAKGVKAGGFNNAVSESELTYEQEENWTYELGAKNRFFDDALTLNAAIYYIDQSTLQGGVPPSEGGLSTSDIITNIGGATSSGIEIESSLRLLDSLSLDVGLTVLDPKYKKGVKYSAGVQDSGSVHCDGVTCPADGDISGNQLSRTSRQQVTAALNYVEYFAGWQVSARIDSNYQSKQYLEPLNLGWVPERQITNASLKFASPSDTWEFSAWGKNITDEDYPANSFVIGVFNQYLVGKGARRTMGANLKYKF